MRNRRVGTNVAAGAVAALVAITAVAGAGRAIGAALQGKLDVIAGSNAHVYDPGTNKWSSIAAPTWEHDGVVRVVINGKPKLLAVGGLNGDTPNNTEVYTR
jgi:hypothetical protein